MSKAKSATLFERPYARTRGFLLMVVIGILALLLALCVGFLAFCRGEVNAVATIRDKNDCLDIMHSAMDWTIANIANDVLDGSGQFDDGKYVAFTHGAGSGQWWYRPYEKGLKTALPQWPASMASMQQRVYRWDNLTDYSSTLPECMDPNGRDEAQWTYLPDNYFPEGGVMGRFMVQVLDPNSVLCLNDWLDDCCPTQTQMAQMIRDSYGLQQLERYYAFRDTADNGAGGWDRQIKLAPIRFQDGWRVATRSLRQPNYTFSYRTTGDLPIREVTPNWVTTNTTYFSPFGAEMILRSVITANGVYNNFYTINYTGGPAQYFPPTPNEGRPGPSGALPWVSGDAGFSRPQAETAYGWNNRTKWTTGQLPTGAAWSIYGYEDPDTGRCPLNINTCYNSGERLPMNMFGGVPSYSLEGVFNVDSLRMIINIGEFHFRDKDGMDQTLNGCDPNAPNFINTLLTDVGDQQNAWIKHERLRIKLAYRYQEKLCRYFTGTYHTKRSSFQRMWPPVNAGTNNNLGFTVGTASTNYGSVRFPMALDAFRETVRTHLAAVSTGSPVVVFDAADNCAVPIDSLDARTANAVFDNIVPGKPGQNGMPAFPDPAGGDPLTELWGYRIAREEYSDDPYERGNTGNLYGYHADRSELFDSGAHGPYWTGIPPAMTSPPVGWNSNVIGAQLANTSTKGDNFWKGLSLAPKGKVIAASTARVGPWDRLVTVDAHLPPGMDTSDVTASLAEGDINKVPYRQWMFGPDWFSTELTTTTTTYMLVINAQVVDRKSVIEDPNKPVVLSHFQFGAAVEVCPDVAVEGGSSGLTWPSGAIGAMDAVAVGLNDSGLGYYRGGNPRVRKMYDRQPVGFHRNVTRVHSMDFKCGSTITTVKAYLGSAGNADTYQHTSIPKEWKADLRGIAAGDENSFYGGARQTTRRILIRGIWSMDNSLSR